MPQELVMPSQTTTMAIEPVKQQDPMLSFIERASNDPAFDASKLRELLAMRRELRLEAAKEDFEASFAQFKEKPPVIQKNRKGPVLKGDQPAYWWADLEECCEKLIPALKAVGITHNWRTSYDGDFMVVTCVLKKGLYADDGTSMRAKGDNTGAKSAVQAEGSTLTYLQRYTLCAACGIAVKGADTNGQGMPTGAVAEQVEWFENARSLDELDKLYKAAANMALDAADKKAIQIFKDARAKKRKEFQ